MTIQEYLTASGLCKDCEIKAAKLEKLTDLVLEWNEHINVTAIRDREEFVQKNVIDSLTLGCTEEFKKASCILDVGTGGGFPGLPLAVVFEDKRFILTDAIAKKLKVVADVAEKLEISNVSVVHSRCEDLAFDKKYREKFDLVTSRAVANMSTLSEYCLPFVKQGGVFAAYKTEDSKEEIETAEKAIKLLGGKTICHIPDGIEGSGHIFVMIRKLAATPSAYPRKAGTPSKDPLK